MKQNTHRIVLLILGVILVCGCYLRNVSVSETKITRPLRADAKDYFMYAYNMRHKHTYSREVVDLDNIRSPVVPDAVRSPGYPLFLMLFVDGLPHEEMLNKILISQMIISTLTILIAFLFFQSFLDNYLAAAAALLVALSPHLIVANSYLLTETLFCFLIVVLGWMTSIFISKPSRPLAGIIGGNLGIASLVRPSVQYFPIMIAFLLLFQYGRRKGTRFLLVFLMGFVLTYSPWIIRNLKTLKVTTNKRLMINFLHHGIYPDFTYDEIPKSFGFPYRYDPRSGEIGKSIGSLLNEIVRRFHSEPRRHLTWYALKKPIVFWNWSLVQGRDVFVYPVSKSPFFTRATFKGIYRFMHACHRQIVVLALLGSLVAWLPSAIVNLPEKSVLIARFASILLIYYTFIHMIGVPFPRYSVPMRPFLYGMALFPIRFLVVCLSRRRPARRVA